MRISDWSSDVCSSDLRRRCRQPQSRPYRLGAGETWQLTIPERSDVWRLDRDRKDAVCRPGFRYSRIAVAPPEALSGMSEKSNLADRLRENLADQRSEEHTSELQSLMRSSYAVFCLKKKPPLISSKKYTNLTANSLYDIM